MCTEPDVYTEETESHNFYESKLIYGYKVYFQS